MKNERIAYTDNDIRTSWFKNHIASYKKFTDETGDVIEFLRWGKPKSNIFCVTYLYRYGILFVFGDVGEAIYQWHTSIGNLKDIAGCNFDYFASKCQASENGRNYKEWSVDCAKEFLRDYITTYAESENVDEEVVWKKLYDLNVWDSLSSNYDWTKWLEQNGYDAFGCDYYEYSDIGMEINHRCRSHLIGLQMAFEQLIEQRKDETNA